MSVDFLSDKEDRDKGRKVEKDSQEEIEWTRPVGKKTSKATREVAEKKINNIKATKPARGGSFLNFFRKREGRDLTDKSKIKKTRKEILKFINEEKKDKTAIVESNKDNKIKNKTWLSNLFKKKIKGEGEVLVDYQKVLEEERGKKKPIIRDETKERKEKEEIKKEARSKEEAVRVSYNDALIKSRRKKDEKVKGQLADKKIKPPVEEEKKEKELVEDYHKELEPNLIKDKIIVFFDWKKNIISFLLLFIVSSLLVAGAYGGLFWWGEKKEAQNQEMVKRLEKLDEQIKQTEENLEEIFAFKKKLKLVDNLLDQHIYWTNFFNFLEENTLPEVYYLNFSGDNSGNYNLPAIAKNFSDIEAQVRQMLESDYVIEAKVDQGSMTFREIEPGSEVETGMVSFELSLSLDPNVFIK